MCGIAGFVGFGLPLQEAEHRLRAMCDAIVHRGPNSAGYLTDFGVSIGMRRLSIIDVKGGDQPIFNEDRTVAVVFNGEIYNHHELRQYLIGRGHRFATRSDTEVLVHLYEEAGPEMVSQLEGMFAYAIWDAKKRLLTMGRDRTGMKPLSYALKSDGLVFCSELRSLLAFDPKFAAVNDEAIGTFLAFGYVPDPQSVFRGVSKLPPAHFLVWSANGGCSVRRYWAPPTIDVCQHDEESIVVELRRHLDRAVAAHLESEVPLGAFLSGGLDSSTVVALMCRHATGRVKTFSIGFEEKEFDESDAARAVAQQLGTDHTELIVRPDVEALFESITGIFDEPFADPSAIPTYLVARLAREKVTVALSGDGGDEIFGGYSRYRETLGSGLSRRIGLMAKLAPALRLMPHIFPGRNWLLDQGRTAWGRYASTVVQPVRIDEGGVASGVSLAARMLVEQQLPARATPTSLAEFAADMGSLDIETYLPGDILTKVDRTTMAVSLEARVPLLDNRLLEFALSIPGNMRVTATESKRLFRRAIHGVVPDFVLTRPKQGFGVPLSAWFRGPLRHRAQALRSPSERLRTFIDPKALQRIVFEHLVGRRDHSSMIWRVLVLESWLGQLNDGSLGRAIQMPKLAFSMK